MLGADGRKGAGNGGSEECVNGVSARESERARERSREGVRAIQSRLQSVTYIHYCWCARGLGGTAANGILPYADFPPYTGFPAIYLCAKRTCSFPGQGVVDVHSL